MSRISSKQRTTSETRINVALNLDGTGQIKLNSGVPFFDHMLELFARHGLFDLAVECIGDTQVDDHHSIEDLGIVMGGAFLEALGDKCGITRYYTQHLPMDETLAMISVDISGRPYLVYNVEFLESRTGNFEACLLEEFLRAFAFASGITLHINLLYGKNTHHIIEAIMKGLGRALSGAVKIDPRVSGVPSTKGVL